MKAIILAAGKGERLGVLTRNTPKSLLEIGRGVTVVESQLDHLAECKVAEVVLVVGYKAEQIEAKLKDYDRLEIRTVYNPFFDVSNNLLSAWMARAEMQDDFMLINGDDVFSSSVVSGLLGVDGGIVMVIDRKEAYDDDDMKVVTEGPLIRRVSKKIPFDESNGESIGMMRFAGTGRQRFVAKLDEMARNPSHRNAFYLQALQELMDEGYPVHFAECDPEDWAEIDFHPDLHLIRDNIQRFSDRIERWG